MLSYTEELDTSCRAFILIDQKRQDYMFVCLLFVCLCTCNWARCKQKHVTEF